MGEAGVDILAAHAARAVLDRHTYKADSIARLLRIPMPLRLRSDDLERHRLLLEFDRPLDVLVATLLLEQDAPLQQTVAALGSDLDVLCRAGLLEVAGDMVCGRLQVVPHGDVLLASDRHDSSSGSDFVPGAHPPTDLLARLTPRDHVARALDLGTGCGAQAVLLSEHADHVVATDVNPRALRFAALTAGMSSANLDLRAGDLLDPVSGELFDLVVSNPPYVISPDRDHVFRDSGREGDALCQELVAQLPSVLAPGGIAVVLVSWIHDGADGPPAPVRWAKGNGCDVLLLAGDIDDPLDSALRWNEPYRGDAQEYARRVHTWTDYYRDMGATGVGYGALVLRQPSSGEATWTAVRPRGSASVGAAGEHVRRLIAAQDLLAAGGLDDVPLVLAPDSEVQTLASPGPDALVTRAVSLRLRGGLGYDVSLDASGAQLMAAFASAALLADALARAGFGPAEEPAAAELVRTLISYGLLVAHP